MVLIPRGGQKIATLLKHRPIGIYRPLSVQVKYFNGHPDGKIEVVLREIKRFQAIASAGDN